MRMPAMLVLTAALMVAANAPADDPGKDEKVQGTWAAVEATFDGKKASDDAVKAMKVVITADKITIKTTDPKVPAQEGTYKLDPTKKPKTIDLTPTSGPDKGKTLAGIYQLVPHLSNSIA